MFLLSELCESMVDVLDDEEAFLICLVRRGEPVESPSSSEAVSYVATLLAMLNGALMVLRLRGGCCSCCCTRRCEAEEAVRSCTAGPPPRFLLMPDFALMLRMARAGEKILANPRPLFGVSMSCARPFPLLSRTASLDDEADEAEGDTLTFSALLAVRRAVTTLPPPTPPGRFPRGAWSAAASAMACTFFLAAPF